MRRRRGLARRDAFRRRAIKLCILVSLTAGLLGVGYAAYTNVLYGVFDISTSSMNFIFDSTDNAAVSLQHGPGGEIRDLGGDIYYENADKKLYITNLGPVNIEDIMEGNAIIRIDYAIKPKDAEQGIRRPAREYDIGPVELTMDNTPVWSLENGSGSWGSESDGLSVPAVIYDFLPDDLGEFQAYNELEYHDGTEVITGTLTLIQESAPDHTYPSEIGLQSLNLPGDIIEDIKSGPVKSTLQIKGTYEFAIPLDLDQFNVKQ